MKVNVKVPFYATGLGIVRRGEAELPDELANAMIASGNAEEISNDRVNSTKSAAKGKAGTKSRNKRI